LISTLTSETVGSSRDSASRSRFL